MKIAFYVEDGLEQIVLTPDGETEAAMLGKLHDGSRELSITKGSFYDCRGGWKRYTPYQRNDYAYGTDSGDESTMIVLRPASGMEAPSGGETENTGSTEGDSPALEEGTPK